MIDLPQLNYKDMLSLKRIRVHFPMQFYQNVTSFFIGQMSEYIKDCRVWRIVLMGETRGGKSETAMTIAKLYVNIFNQYLKKDAFKHMKFDKYLKVAPLTFGIDYVVGSQSNYIYTLREQKKSGKLKFGQIWQIDENRENVGGLGTFSEMLDLANINNIVAKFMQSELWLTPVKLQQRNAPYGLYVYKKDTVNRVNWCLLYKIEMGVKGTLEYIFMGWVKVPLHHDVNLRNEYEMKKNKWIANEIEGAVDQRVIQRKHAAEQLSKDPVFSEMSKSGKSFALSKDQQLALLEQYIIEGKTQRWNELEMYRIISEGRMLVMQRINKERSLELEQEFGPIKDKKVKREIEV
ncbi:hypothetical protein LCGC14_0363410 [marine sediment metagenome]|uniref:Uncharacterized protein n=1 Tax=marine sediment metagenome TaxID=412755 RepID=A0A0F9TD61_9ZZZZ